MSFRDLALTAFVLLMLPVAATGPHVGVYLWYWLAYMGPHHLAWGMARNIPFAQLVAIATLIGLFVSREKRRIPWNATTLLLIAFTIWVSITTYFAVNEAPAQKQYEQFLKIQLMTFVTIFVINSRQRLLWLVWVLVGSIGVYGLKGGIFTLITGGEYRVWGPPKGMLSGNNELGLGLVVILPFMRYLQLTTTNRFVRHGLTVVMLLCGAAILGTHSRGAFLGLAVTALALAVKSRHRLLLIVILIVAAVVVVNYAPERWFTRMQTIRDYEEERSAMGRINAWYFAFNLAKDYPLVGGGFDVFTPEMFLKYAPDPEDFHDSHSIYFGVLGEHGFVGLGLFLLLGISTFRKGGRILRATKQRDDLQWARDLAAMTQVSLIGYATNGAFLGLAYFELAYNLIAIMVVLHVLVRKSEAPTSEPIENAIERLPRHSSTARADRPQPRVHASRQVPTSGARRAAGFAKQARRPRPARRR